MFTCQFQNIDPYDPYKNCFEINPTWIYFQCNWLLQTCYLVSILVFNHSEVCKMRLPAEHPRPSVWWLSAAGAGQRSYAAAHTSPAPSADPLSCETHPHTYSVKGCSGRRWAGWAVRRPGAICHRFTLASGC